MRRRALLRRRRPRAKKDIRVLFEELIPRLEAVELTGDPQWTAASFVNGVKHLPVRWNLR